MVNILSYRADDGREVQINQAELKTKDGLAWLIAQLRDRHDAVLSHEIPSPDTSHEDLPQS